MISIRSKLAVCLSRERGASAVEYSIMAGFIAAVVILAVVFLGEETKGAYDCTKESIENSDERC